MISMTDLWLPILLSAVFVFIVSSIVHMILPFHKGDFKKMPGEDSVLAQMRAHGLQPGSYMFPCAGSMKEMCSPEMIEKCKLGPVGQMTIIPSGAPGMGKNLIQWFLFCVIVSAVIAGMASHILDLKSPHKTVFHLTALAAILGYATRPLPDSIWKGQPWNITFKFVIDGILYAVVTGLTFAWLWPA